jgi:hypothetical protein
MSENINTSDVREELNCRENNSRISIMEEKYKVVEDHTITVSKLSAKVSLLLTIMSFCVMIVSGAAVYTFTGLNNFKDIYVEDRIEIHKLINDTQINNRILIEQSIRRLEAALYKRIDVIEDNMEIRMNDIEKQYIELKTKIEE